MSRAVAVLRPEPGNAATIARLDAIGLATIRLPLFEVRALDWAPSDPSVFDALILTSANAVRFGGAGLAELRDLPVHAVGATTAAAAREAGFTIAVTGDADAAALVDRMAAIGVRRALLLAGRERKLDAGGIVAQAEAVYASEPLPVAPATVARLDGAVALLHSARAASRLAELIDAAAIDRAALRLAAISRAVADAAGPGWADIATADVPTDDALVACAAALAD
ncbi:MAG: uroporphyrinogen-III synthase [Sphingomonas sp.]|uniref:uroporphyrinogen-III synthase n=1 Tax=Sphingomonas sp. TaxID=28214 RepID=UPI001AC8EEC8|nr:uroporphyrinogen-III synthase [Sphingomonas sp.]MBN8809100.1 uroporphyrinogen-III synthase [Sphingomonas sp.]